MKPLQGRFRNRVEIANEFCIIICEMYLFIYTDFVANKTTQSLVSYSNVGIIIVVIACNMIIVIYYCFKSLYLWFYL